MVKKEEKPILDIKVEETEVSEKKEEILLDFDKKEKVSNIPVGSVSFPCPNCTKSVIVRGFNKRRLATPYKCECCGFIGPN